MTPINSLQQVIGEEVPDKNKHGSFLKCFCCLFSSWSNEKKVDVEEDEFKVII